MTSLKPSVVRLQARQLEEAQGRAKHPLMLNTNRASKWITSPLEHALPRTAGGERLGLGTNMRLLSCPVCTGTCAAAESALVDTDDGEYGATE